MIIEIKAMITLGECASCFCHCDDRMSDMNNFREKGFILAHGFRGFIHRFWF
jgi:hypothetical protein